MNFLAHWIPSLAAAVVLASAALILRSSVRHKPPVQRPSSPITTSRARSGLTGA